MKHDVQIFKSLKSVAKGDKVYGVVVAQNEHGHIVKSFGEVKGLLTFADIKENASKKDKYELKTGSIVKAYVLFNKKGSGLALTLDKKKARKTEEVGATDQRTLSQFLPTDEESVELKQTYNSLLKNSADSVGKVITFIVIEQRQNFYVIKSVLEKKQKFAVLPKPLSSAFGVSLPLDD
jgi:predicted RNA-binding protein with RPS1 domain